MDLSVVIPAFNEAAKIARDVEAAASFLRSEGLRGEVIVVDDGSSDGTAQAARSAEPPPEVECSVIRYEPHRGKGYAVRTGILATRGRIVMFADSGLCVPMDNACRGMDLIERDVCEVAHGTRYHHRSRITRAQPWYRRVLSRSFRAVVHGVMGIPWHMTDTQCGFKVYRGDVGRRLYARCSNDGFVFDVEVMLRALRQGYRVREFPVEWTCDIDSRLQPARNAFAILRDLAAIRLRLARGD